MTTKKLNPTATKANSLRRMILNRTSTELGSKSIDTQRYSDLCVYASMAASTGVISSEPKAVILLNMISKLMSSGYD